MGVNVNMYIGTTTAKPLQSLRPPVTIENKRDFFRVPLRLTPQLTLQNRKGG